MGDDLRLRDRVLICFDSHLQKHVDVLGGVDVEALCKPYQKKGRVEVDISIGGMLLERVDGEPGKTKLSIVWNVDPKMYLPPMALNWFTAQFASLFMRAIVSKAANVDKEPQYK